MQINNPASIESNNIFVSFELVVGVGIHQGKHSEKSYTGTLVCAGSETFLNIFKLHTEAFELKPRGRKKCT